LITDIVIGLQHGDEGKGKVTHHLLKSGEYTHCIRFNGGCNAGHTIYHDGTKFVTHHIPAGVFFGIPSIIGPGCVLNVNKLLSEMTKLADAGIELAHTLKIANNVHIITEEHIKEDSLDEKIGTTKSGNGPAYRDKYGRNGMRAIDIPFLKPFLIDVYEELHNCKNEPVILMEGAQGFWLDPDWGDYPYVTSSHCGVAAGLLNGVDPRSLRNVWGVAKIYETYVGAKQFQPPNQIFNKIQEAGQEFGATTGRVRQCNWLDFKKLEQAIRMNGANMLIFNKMDVLREIDQWAIKNPHLYFDGEQEIKDFLQSNLPRTVEKIYFSDSPEFI
jgi:adenylosuccinate synthase